MSRTKTIKIIEPVNCMFCGKTLKPLHGSDYGMVNDGMVGHFYAPYGSSFDGNIFQMAICDNCVKTKEKEDKIILVGDYMFGSAVNHKGEEVKLQYDKIS